MTTLKRPNQCPSLLLWLKNNIPAGSTVLDVGCGNKWHWPHIDARFIGIDAWPRFEPDYVLDLEKQDLPYIEADIVLFMDVIEHLSRARGLSILKQTMRLGKSVFLLTPTVWDSNEEVLHNKECDYYENPFAPHKSLWTEAELCAHGFSRTKEVFADKYFHGVWKRV